MESKIDQDYMKSYTEVDRVLKDKEFRVKTRKRLIVIAVSSFMLVAIIAAATFGMLVPHKEEKITNVTSLAESIRAVCQVTLNPDSCLSSLLVKGSSSSKPSKPLDPQQIFVMSLQVALQELVNVSSSSYFSSNIGNDRGLYDSLRNCKYLLSDAFDHVNISLLSAALNQKSYNAGTVSDMRTWLSTAITDQETCIDGVDEFGTNYEIKQLRIEMEKSREFTSNSLAIITNLFKIPNLLNSSKVHNRKLLEMHIDEKVVVVRNGEFKPNVTVAQDGSGDFMTIKEALISIPRNNSRKQLLGNAGRYVIYVKQGVYKENVIIGKDLYNLTMYGDGMNKTIVSGSLNAVDGSKTFDSATFIAEGNGFIGIDMGFKNTAGPEKEQAVAVRSSSDHSIFYSCSFDAYQDTLYTFSNRQFYRDCHITGTIDFIFGNAAVIFQNCTIVPRQPLPKQFNTITAQSKSDPNQNTGFLIQRSRISSSSNTNLTSLTATTRTYLGRPWKNYSTVIFMESDIGEVVDPAGWSQWTPGLDPPNSIFYAEYRNTGIGSLLSQRVQWSGYRPTLTEEEVNMFNVESFIQGNTWLTAASVAFDAN